VARFSASATSELLQTFTRLNGQGPLKVEVGATFSLREAPQAHTLLQSRHRSGRIVLHID
jgi:NADPH:quinone reductase-like Zn-dependent oxidoreductase